MLPVLAGGLLDVGVFVDGSLPVTSLLRLLSLISPLMVFSSLVSLL